MWITIKDAIYLSFSFFFFWHKILSRSKTFVQVIQRRFDFGEPRENFNRDWADYKNGFGDPAREFWLGNENIYMLTNNEDYMLRVELEDFEGNKRYAHSPSLNTQ